MPRTDVRVALLGITDDPGLILDKTLAELRANDVDAEIISDFIKEMHLGDGQPLQRALTLAGRYVEIV